MEQKKPVTYRWFYAAIACVAICIIAYLKFKTSTHEAPPDITRSTEPSAAPSVPQEEVTEINQAIQKTDVKSDSAASAKIKILKEIFASKNDNDPRLDSEFKNLSDDAKESLKEEYSKLPRESRNERGTIVFILGREVRSASELSFFRKVLNETPCLSMSDCEKLGPPPVGEEAHLETLAQTTLAYPELMALKMQERIYRTSDDQSIKEAAISIIQEATRSPIRSVEQEARSILERIRAK